MDPVTISAILGGAFEAIKFISAERERAMQSSEWTPEQEAAFQSKMSADFAQPWWKPSSK